MQIFVEEPDNARDWLSKATVSTLLEALLPDSGRLGSRALYVQPERLWLRVHLSSSVTEATITQWLQILLELAI